MKSIPETNGTPYNPSKAGRCPPLLTPGEELILLINDSGY
jgi:hypothetical protein